MVRLRGFRVSQHHHSWLNIAHGSRLGAAIDCGWYLACTLQELGKNEEIWESFLDHRGKSEKLATCHEHQKQAISCSQKVLAIASFFYEITDEI